MNILMLTPYLPYPLLSGGQIRTYNLLKKLHKKHSITLFALIKEETERNYVAQLEPFCKKIKVFKRTKTPFTLSNILKTGFSTYPFLVIRNLVPAAREAIKQELKTGEYDLIHAETFYMMPHLPETSIPTILVEQTIEYLGYESYAAKAHPLLKPFLSIDIAKIKRWETHFWKKADHLITMSETDKEYIVETLENQGGEPRPLRCDVVSNGVDSQWFGEVPRRLPPEPTVLSVGTFKWLPNVEAVDYLVTKIWPLLKKKVTDARLWIVGNEPTPQVLTYQKKDSSITVTGGIPDIRDAFQGAHVVVAPVFSGKGTRYKILEAMASGTPVVATSVAVEGLGITPGVHALVADTAEELAEHTAELLRNDVKREQLAKAGKLFVKKHYDWDSISDQLDAVYTHYEKK